jgi:hypothetical protein
VVAPTLPAPMTVTLFLAMGVEDLECGMEFGVVRPFYGRRADRGQPAMDRAGAKRAASPQPSPGPATLMSGSPASSPVTAGPAARTESGTPSAKAAKFSTNIRARAAAWWS